MVKKARSVDAAHRSGMPVEGADTSPVNTAVLTVRVRHVSAVLAAGAGAVASRRSTPATDPSGFPRETFAAGPPQGSTSPSWVAMMAREGANAGSM